MFPGNWNIGSSCEISLGYGFCVSRNMGLEKRWKGSIRKTALEEQHWKTALEGQHWKDSIGKTALERQHWKAALEGPHWESAFRKGSVRMGVSIGQYPRHCIRFFMLCMFCARAYIISLYVSMALSRACGQGT